ncbi:MAG: hypothetical protein RLZZ299_1446 [Pseudomonadota bacterium]
MRTCDTCGTSIEGRRADARFCGGPCRARGAKRGSGGAVKGRDDEADTRSVSSSGATGTRTEGRGSVVVRDDVLEGGVRDATLAALLRRVEALEGRAVPPRDPMTDAPSREEVEDHVDESMGVLREELARTVGNLATRAAVERLQAQVAGARGPDGDVPTREEVEDQVAEAMALLREEFSRTVAQLAARAAGERAPAQTMAPRTTAPRTGESSALAARIEAVEAAQETLSQEVAELADGLTRAIGAWVG